MGGNSQVKDNKIDLLVQQYEQLTILEEESIDSSFTRFNTIITSLKALDEGKKEKVKSIALKSKKDFSDDETSTSGSDEKEYAMAVLGAIAKMTSKIKPTMKLLEFVFVEIFEESVNVTFDESPPPTKLSPLVDDDVGEEEAIKKNTKVVNNNNEEDESIEVDEIVNIKESKNQPLDQVIGNLIK
ncbi:hypothetical protein Tco_1492553 [Tanacetum coccineum]